MDPHSSADVVHVVAFANELSEDFKAEVQDIEEIHRSVEPAITLPSISDSYPPIQDEGNSDDGRYEVHGLADPCFNQNSVQVMSRLTRIFPVTESYAQPSMGMTFTGLHNLPYPGPAPQQPPLTHQQTTLPGLDLCNASHRPPLTTYGGYEWTEQNRGNAVNSSSQHQIPRTSYHDDNHWPRVEQPIPAAPHVGHSDLDASHGKRSHSGDQFGEWFDERNDV